MRRRPGGYHARRDAGRPCGVRQPRQAVQEPVTTPVDPPSAVPPEGAEPPDPTDGGDPTGAGDGTVHGTAGPVSGGGAAEPGAARPDREGGFTRGDDAARPGGGGLDLEDAAQPAAHDVRPPAPSGWRATAGRAGAWPLLPVVLLAVVSLASLGARVLWLDNPCAHPCVHGYDHALIFDEVYYVNAARRILGIAVPSMSHYADSPAGYDPNAEHPQLAKLAIAAGIRAFGDDPLGWRFGSLVMGSLAILAVYWLVRSAGGGRWLALGAASLMAVDNLVMVHGRIATLEIYELPPMLAAMALYLRGRPLLAGAALGVAACVKLTAPYLVLVLLVFEAILLARRLVRSRSGTDGGERRAEGERWAGMVRLTGCVTVAIAVYAGLLYVMDTKVPPFDSGSQAVYYSPLTHTAHMISYASSLKSPGGPTGIASYPWQWLLDLEPINFFSVNVTVTTGQDSVVHPVVAFIGQINPFIIVLALPAFGAAAVAAWRTGDPLDTTATAWCLGAFLPFVVASGGFQRTSYLYYMVLVMPGVYLALVRLLARLPRSAVAGYACALGYGFEMLYPFRTFTGG